MLLWTVNVELFNSQSTLLHNQSAIHLHFQVVEDTLGLERHLKKKKEKSKTNLFIHEVNRDVTLLVYCLYVSFKQSKWAELCWRSLGAVSVCMFLNTRGFDTRGVLVLQVPKFQCKRKAVIWSRLIKLHAWLYIKAQIAQQVVHLPRHGTQLKPQIKTQDQSCFRCSGRKLCADGLWWSQNHFAISVQSSNL